MSLNARSAEGHVEPAVGPFVLSLLSDSSECCRFHASCRCLVLCTGPHRDCPQEEASSGLPGAGVTAGVPALLPRSGRLGRALWLPDQQTPPTSTADLGGPEPKSRKAKAARGRPGLLGHLGFPPPGGSWPSPGNSATCCGSVRPRSLLGAGTALGPGSAGPYCAVVPPGLGTRATRDPTPWDRPALDPGPCLSGPQGWPSPQGSGRECQGLPTVMEPQGSGLA